MSDPVENAINAEHSRQERAWDEAMTQQPDTDAIAELVAELEDEAQQLSGSSIRNGCPDCGISANLALKSADTIADLRNKVEGLTEALKPFLPITINETPDYAELYFGEHETQAMTMRPGDWLKLNDAAQALTTHRGGL